MAPVLKKYVNVPPPRATTAFGKQLRAQTFAYNRLGNTLTGIGKNLQGIITMMETQKEFFVGNFAERTKEQKKETKTKLSMRKQTAKKKKKKEDRIQDQQAEVAQELEPNEEEENEEGLKQAEEAPKKKLSWIETFAAPFKPLFSFIKNIIKPLLVVGFMTWLSDPKNTKRIETFLRFIRGLGKLVFGLVSFGMSSVLDGIGNIFGDREPGQSHLSKAFEAMFGVFKILGGMASFWLASRMLMPWKLLSDVKAMRSIGKALSMGEKPDFKKNQKNQKKDQKKKDQKKKQDKKQKKDNKKKQQKKNQKTTKTKTKAPKPKPKTFADRVKQTKETIKNKRKAIQEGAEKFVEKNVKPLATKGQKLLEKVKVKKPPGGGSWWKSLKTSGKNLWKSGVAKGTNFKNFLGNQGTKFLKWADKFAKQQLKNADNVIGGVRAKAGTWAKNIGKIAEMAKNPGKLFNTVKKQLMGKLDDIVKNNKSVKNVLDMGKKAKGMVKDPKSAGKAIRQMLKGAKNNKNILKLRSGLKAAKSMKIGGVDAVIAALMGVIDYTAFGESPINAVVNALGGLLGYTAGFAIGAPFGGAPGFITGMAGAFVGDFIASKLLQGLSKTGLANITDPIMGAGKKGDGRKLVRDPFGGGDAPEEEVKKDESKVDPKPKDKKDIPEVKEEKKFFPSQSPFIKGKKIGLTKGYKKYKNHMFDMSKEMGGLDREQFYQTDDLDNRGRKLVNSAMGRYRRTTGVKPTKYGFDHKTLKYKEAPKKGIGGTIPFQVGKRSIGGGINTSGTVGSKVPKINRPVKRKRKAKTNTVVVAARQQVYIPGSNPTPAPQVVYTATPVMLNGKMRS